ncbi:MAG: hypothetical protein V5A87_01440 [Candidatus Bipolaricaulota bacterium]|nr:hypothetical protein [Candidatus Bipolaricaulota bacterium]
MGKGHEGELDRYIDSGDPLNFILENGMTLTGVVNWQDGEFINVEGSIEGNRRNCTISKSSLLCFYEHQEGDDKFATIENI